MMNYTDVLHRVPEGKMGHAEIIHDTPTKFERLSGAIHGMPLCRYKYCRLKIDGRTYMTDAEFERRTNNEFMRQAHGDVLIAGLGIGLILDPLFERCNSVTVIENDPDVIALVGPHYPKATIIEANILQWKPAAGSAWDTIYFDIWPIFGEDQVAEGRKLERRFRKYLKEYGYMQSWSRIALKSISRRYR